MLRRLLLLVAAVLACALPVHADQGGVVRFATLPQDGPGFPEGIAADQAGNLYVATFDFSKPNLIYVFGRNGQLRASVPVPGVPLGLAFDSAGNLYAANFGGGNVLRYAPPFNAGSLPTVLPVTGCTGPFECGLNALAFDAAGALYVSDSFGGRIFKLELPAGTSTVFSEHELLKPGSHGFPPFGANGLAIRGGDLYVANTADDRILKINLATKVVSTFAESVNGADGLAFDPKGRLWVAANQADEIVALNDKGRVVERRGSFQGVGRDGAPKGLLFPASLVLSGGSLYVTNLALVLTPAAGDEPEEDVTTYTVSRIPLNDD